MADATKRRVQRQCETFPSPLNVTGRNGCFRVSNDPQYPNAFKCRCITDECNLIDADKMAELWRTGGNDWHPNQPPWFSEGFDGETSSPPTMQPPPGRQAKIVPFNNLTFHMSSGFRVLFLLDVQGKWQQLRLSQPSHLRPVLLGTAGWLHSLDGLQALLRHGFALRYAHKHLRGFTRRVHERFPL
ncbi:hypothetical protein RvY_19027-3 [Ramazzottius varieornatus]|uniref:Uncharacterized protein n=1 Tax=Ramazzottius varieornatus TaxID=947166 RepID=A0A1D1W7Y8_RAMVA|nr:hypothetical protein RvY_19027-3 [Ramazzottius varieornatus]